MQVCLVFVLPYFLFCTAIGMVTMACTVSQWCVRVRAPYRYSRLTDQRGEDGEVKMENYYP